MASTGTLAPAARPAAASEAARRPKPRLASLGDLLWLLYPLLPQRWVFATAKLHGTLQYLLRTRARHTVRNNYAALFPGRPAAELDALTLQFLQNQRAQNLLVMLAPRMSTATLARFTPFQHLERLREALDQGRGVIVLASHVNSASLFAGIVWLRRAGYDVRLAQPTTRDPWERTRLRRLAERLAGVAPLKEQMGAFFAQFNVRPIVAALRQGAAVVVAGDGWHAAGFVDVTFLGRVVPFSTGALAIARMTGAVVVPVFNTGRPPGRLRFVVEPAFTVPRDGTPQRDLEPAAAAYAAQVERHVLAHPAGWQHLLVANVLDTLAGWRQRSLAERYAL